MRTLLGNLVRTVVAIGCGLWIAGAGIGSVSAQGTVVSPMDINGGGGGGIGAPPGLSIRVPNTVGQFNGFRFSTTAGDGPLAGFSGEVVAPGSYPNSAGRAHLWVQDGSTTRSIAVFSKFGVQVIGGGGSGLGRDRVLFA